MIKVTHNELDEICNIEKIEPLIDPNVDKPAELTPVKQCFEFLIEATLASQECIELYIVDLDRHSALARVKKSRDIVSAYILQEMPLKSSVPA
jgi:hypothetical protein